MKINFVETKNRIYATGRTLRGYARTRGFNPFSFTQFLKGAYVSGAMVSRFIDALREDGFLVEEPNGDQAAE